MFKYITGGRQGGSHRRITIRLLLCVAALLVIASVNAQQSDTLPEGATVSALGRSAQVRSDGSFSISNVPANIGRFRVRLIHPNGMTAESNCLTPVDRGTTLVPPLVFGALTPVSTMLAVQSSQNILTEQGQTAQLQVTAHLQGGGTIDITNSLCTTYISSNTSFVTVNASGLVTVNNMPLVPATLIVTVTNEGVVGTVSLLLNPGPATTDLDGDGMPNDWELRNGFDPTFPGDAVQDADGDGLNNRQEFQQNLAPRDPDTDRDGISDGANDPDGAGPIIAGPDPQPLQPETVPPTCTLSSPANGVTLIEGETIVARAEASDNVGITRVTFTSNVGALNVTDFSSPYEAPFVVPTGITQVSLTATARDIAGNTGASSPVTINVLPDPLTTVIGRVVDESMTPLEGATVSVLSRMTMTGTDGTFSIPTVPTVQGNLVVNATLTLMDGTMLVGRSAPTAPVRGGTTNVGDIVVLPPAFDFVYTNNNTTGGNTVSAFSVDANGALTQIAGSPFATGGDGGGGGFFAANRISTCVVGTFLFVSNDGSNNISAFSIDPMTGSLTPVPGSPFATGAFAGEGISLGVTPDNRFLFAANSGSNNITTYSIGANGALTIIPGSPVPAGGQPDGVRVSPDGRFLSVALISLDRIAIFSIASNGAITSVPGSPFPAAAIGIVAGIDINCAGNLLFAGEANNGGTHVDVFSIGSNGALTPVPGSPFNNPGLGNNSNVVLLSPDDSLLFVSNQFSNTVTVFNVAANGSLSLVSGSPFNGGGGEPSGIATNAAGTFLYAANFDSSSVSVFSINNSGVLTPVTGSPFSTGRPGNSGLLSLAAFPAKNCAPLRQKRNPPK